MNLFKNLFKKNQIIVFTIGLMLITAGYLSYTNNFGSNNETKEVLTTSSDVVSSNLEQNTVQANELITNSEKVAGIGDAKLVSANVAESVNTNIIDDKNVANAESNNNIEENNNVEDISLNTSVESLVDEYFTTSKLERETMYSQRIENYQDILNNTNVTEVQKKTAQEEIAKLSNEQNAIMIAENLIKTKGIKDVVIFVNGDSINAIVKGKDLEKSEIAQIQNIITRELEADIGNIHIMTKE